MPKYKPPVSGKRALPRIIKIMVDTREQKAIQFPQALAWFRGKAGVPLLFPVKTVPETMYAGDYALVGMESQCIIETKRSLHELALNLFVEREWERTQRAFDRMAQTTRHPVLVLDGDLNDFDTWKINKPGAALPSPDAVMDRLAEVCSFYGLHLMMTGKRPQLPRDPVKRAEKKRKSQLRLGNFILRLLMQYSWGEKLWSPEMAEHMTKVQYRSRAHLLPRANVPLMTYAH